MKPTAWYDPSNGVVSTDRDSPLFTPMGQVWPLFPKGEWVGLTDEELHQICNSLEYYGDRGLVQLVEAKLRSKNNA